MPYSSTAGILIKWFKDNFLDSLVAEGKKQNRSPYDLMDKLAESVPAGSGGLMTLPHFAGRFAPRYDPDATGVFYGVGLQSRREHFIRSIYEGVGFVLRENLEFLEVNGINSDVLYSVGGGSQSTLWTQIKSDICRKEIVLPVIYQTTSVGAAILGSVSAGIFADVAQACSRLKYASTFHPNEENAKIYDGLFSTYLKLNQKLFD
jgi:gluconokinase